MYQDDHSRTSSPWPEQLLDASSHSLVEPYIIEEVDMGELHALPSNRHVEMFSSNLESSAEYELDN